MAVMMTKIVSFVILLVLLLVVAAAAADWKVCMIWYNECIANPLSNACLDYDSFCNPHA